MPIGVLGFFNGSVMSLSLTNLNTFDEVVFKPLLSGSIVEIEFRYSKKPTSLFNPVSFIIVLMIKF